MLQISPAVLGLLRAVGFTVLVAVLHFLGNSVNLTPFINSSLATVIATIALMFEHSVEGTTGNALFGAVHTQ